MKNLEEMEHTQAVKNTNVIRFRLLLPGPFKGYPEAFQSSMSLARNKLALTPELVMLEGVYDSAITRGELKITQFAVSFTFSVNSAAKKSTRFASGNVETEEDHMLSRMMNGMNIEGKCIV